jgi:hypothetical protein
VRTRSGAGSVRRSGAVVRHDRLGGEEEEQRGGGGRPHGPGWAEAVGPAWRGSSGREGFRPISK